MPAFQPEVLEVYTQLGEAVRAEGMDVAIAQAAPVHELDSEFVSALGRAHKLVLIELQQGIEVQELGDGRFAHPDCAEFLGLNQLDMQAGGAEHFCEGGCSHPAGRSDDDKNDLQNAAVGIDATLRGHDSTVAMWAASPAGSDSLSVGPCTSSRYSAAGMCAANGPSFTLNTPRPSWRAGWRVHSRSPTGLTSKLNSGVEPKPTTRAKRRSKTPTHSRERRGGRN